MRSKRTWLVGATSALLVAFALLIAMSSRTDEVSSDVQWRVTVLRDGKTIVSSLHPTVPTNLSAMVPNDMARSSVSIVVEPIKSASRFGGMMDLSTSEREIIEFLLLLPPATLLVCLFRNVLGLTSFGTFAPALLGLAFRQVDSLLGVLVVLTIISAGWWLRRGLQPFHLLQVPRTALLLSLVVVMLLVLLFALRGVGPQPVALFPMVILTGMIERFWAMEEEDGVSSSLSVLISTLLIAACVWATATLTPLAGWMMRHPESLALVMAAQLLLGRYTGYRLLELRRFANIGDASEIEAKRGMTSRPRFVSGSPSPSAAECHP